MSLRYYNVYVETRVYNVLLVESIDIVVTNYTMKALKCKTLGTELAQTFGV